MDFFQVQSLLLAYKTDLFLKYKLHTLAIFGSVSRGDNNLNSDIDILVEFKQPIGIAFLDLADDLEEILQSKVDLVSRKGIKDRYFQHIKSELRYV